MIYSLFLCLLLWRCNQAKGREKEKKRRDKGISILQKLNNKLNNGLNNPNFTVYVKEKYTDDECDLH